MLTEMEKLEMYGDMTEEEIKLCYNHDGNYKGWACHYTGCGTLIFQKGFKEVRAHRGWEVKNWVPACWQECKQKIDSLEDDNG